MSPASPAAHEHLALEAELSDGPVRFARERLRLPMGLEASFGWLRHPPTVLVVPRCADGRLLLLRRYHPAVGRWVLEFPSGVLMAEESPEVGAARLVGSLTGLGCGAWRQLGVLRPNPGYSDEVIHLFLARGLTRLEQPPAGDEDEDLEVLLMEPAELDAAIASGDEALDGKSVTAWFRARQRLLA